MFVIKRHFIRLFYIVLLAVALITTIYAGEIISNNILLNSTQADNETPLEFSNTLIPNQNVFFYANYTNSSNNQVITDANCTFNFVGNSTLLNYTYNATKKLYQINLTNGLEENIYEYNTTCYATDFPLLTILDNVTVEHPNSVVINLNRTSSDTFTFDATPHIFRANITDNAGIQKVEFRIYNVSNYLTHWFANSTTYEPDILAMAVSSQQRNSFIGKTNQTWLDKCIDTVIYCGISPQIYSHQESLGNITTFLNVNVTAKVTAESVSGQCTDNLSQIVGYQLNVGNIVASSQNITNALNACPSEVSDAYINMSSVNNSIINASSIVDSNRINITNTSAIYQLNFTNYLSDLTTSTIDYVYVWNAQNIHNSSNTTTIGILNVTTGTPPALTPTRLELLSLNKNNNTELNLSTQFIFNFSNPLDVNNNRQIILKVNNQEIEYSEEFESNILTIISLEDFEENSNISLIINHTVNDTYSSDFNRTAEYNFTTPFRDSDNNGTIDSNDNDLDGDDLNNTVDFIFGNETNIHTNYVNISIEINNTTPDNKSYNSTELVQIYNGSLELIRFNYNFSDNNTLDFRNISIIKQKNNQSYYTIINGINTSSKTIVFEHNVTINTDICIIDNESVNITEFSTTCSNDNEVFVECDGTTQSGYTCTYENNLFNISGLNNTGLKVQCSESWSTGSFGACSGSTQTRTVTDTNDCGTIFSKPTTSQSCSTGGSGSSSSSSSTTTTTTTTTVVTEEEEDIIEDEIINEEDQDEEKENNDKEDGNNEDKEKNPDSDINSESNDQRSVSEEYCSKNNINFNKISNCNFKKIIEGKFQINEYASIKINQGSIYYDKSLEIDYIPKETIFLFKNSNSKYQPTFIFESSDNEIESKANELLGEISGNNLILIVKEGSVSIKKENKVQIIESGNAFITNTISGKTVKSAFDSTADVYNVLGEIKTQLKESDGDLDFIILQDAKKNTGVEIIHKIIFFILIGSSVISFALVRSEDIRFYVEKKLYTPHGIINKQISNTIELNHNQDNKNSNNPIKEKITNTENIIKEAKQINKEKIIENNEPKVSKLIKYFKNPTTIIKLKPNEIKNKKIHDKIDNLFLNKKITKSKYKELLKQLIDVETNVKIN
ncbi:hypothetical protein HOK68_04865 [Candidatus Woesearchaeota archaeon]|nr:hypothetical protein [Candidatus Woesearchaeota archaeon]MBT4387186.1 hypothetical protein [Candidatus Woesearchaeota archaeon]MBT4596057.1 hypothetical protein [Candidatus Woesearchaeota archaeon]MBT5740765.1 hypothetical protein [Candidatus Woesearchaeota archaeon]MBT6506079.1 hypothetical protein [Candidatus Woesearchaeota archaeon]